MARSVPTNYAILGVLTFSEAYSVATITQFYQREIIQMALIGTLGIVSSLTLYAMTTKRDFTLMGGSMFMFMMGIMILGIFNWFFQIPLITGLLFCAGFVMEGFYLIYDVQLICGQKRGKFEVDDYILAAMNLYIDIIRIFLKLLQILQKLQENKEKDEEDN